MFTQTRIRRKAFTIGGRVVRYVKTHKMEMVQLGVMAAVVLASDTGFASTTEKTVFDSVASPMSELEKFATGKFAKGAATVGLIGGGGSFMINADNQIVKRSMQGAGAAGFLCAVPGIVNTLFGFVVP